MRSGGVTICLACIESRRPADSVCMQVTAEKENANGPKSVLVVRQHVVRVQFGRWRRLPQCIHANCISWRCGVVLSPRL